MAPDSAGTHRMVAYDAPTADQFLYAGWSADPPRRLPFVRRSAERARWVARCRAHAVDTERDAEVVSATVYETEMIPPLPGIPRWDILMLIRTRTPDRAARAHTDLLDLEPDFVMPARNIRRIAETDRTRSATFLFNHFTADDPAAAVDGFDRVAAWFPDKLGVDNTTLLRPTDPASASPYVFVNYVRVPAGARGFLASMLTRPSFHTHVRRVLRAHRMTALPLLASPV